MREILFRGKRIDNEEWVEGCLVIDESRSFPYKYRIQPKESGNLFAYAINPETISQYTGLTDKNGKKIWENDILMCHRNSDDLVKAVFGEFGVRNTETGTVVDNVIGWHYEVIPTDEISRAEPFCYSMPLIKDYIELCEMEVIDDPELSQRRQNDKTCIRNTSDDVSISEQRL